VPTGEEAVDRAQAALRRHGEARPALALGQTAIRRGHGFERAHDRRTDRDHAAVPAADSVDEPCGRGRHMETLGRGRLVALG
jgi:hypothetical protein